MMSTAARSIFTLICFLIVLATAVVLASDLDMVTTTTTVNLNLASQPEEQELPAMMDTQHHYDDPPCAFSEEQPIRIMGIEGQFCSPMCDATTNACTKDVPEGATGTPTCALESPSGEKYCAILCVPSNNGEETGGGECGPMSCQPIPNQPTIGICTYIDSSSSLMLESTKMLRRHAK